MSLQDISIIIGFVITGLGLLVTLIGFIKELVSGKVKEFIVVKMEEAEASGKTGEEKLSFVIEAVKEKYKFFSFVLNVKEFIQSMIDFSKKVNAKKKVSKK